MILSPAITPITSYNVSWKIEKNAGCRRTFGNTLLRAFTTYFWAFRMLYNIFQLHRESKDTIGHAKLHLLFMLHSSRPVSFPF